MSLIFENQIKFKCNLLSNQSNKLNHLFKFIQFFKSNNFILMIIIWHDTVTQQILKFYIVLKLINYQ